MLVSQVFFGWAICVAVIVIATLIRNVWKKNSVLELMVLSLIMSVFYPVVNNTNSSYNSVLVQSDNFRESFSQLDTAVKMSGKNHLKFVIEEIMDYRYLDGPPIAVFISSNFPIADENISWTTKDKIDLQDLDPDTLYVLYDDEMKISSSFAS
jgi:hypothetical protein